MRRSSAWMWQLAVAILAALTVIQYAALAWVIPQQVVYVLREALDDTVTVGGAHLRFPFTVVLTDVRSDREWPQAGFHAAEVTVQPAWVSRSTRTVILRNVDVQRLWVHVSRTSEGTIVWPALSQHTGTTAKTDEAEVPEGSIPSREDGWKVSVESLNLTDATMAFYDGGLKEPFYGALDHVSVVAGPVSWPSTAGPITLAVRGKIVGHKGNAAPMYCSGWFNPESKSLDASCQLEPLALAAFEPYYYQGRVQARLYKATLNSTSQWSARDNHLEGRIQLTIDDLEEGDLSVRGRTLVDIKEKLAPGETPTLTGEVKVAGPLHDTSQWQFELVPGNEIVQRLIKPLLDRGREEIRLRVGGERIEVGISAATEDEMSDIKQTSKEVEAALEILTQPLPDEEVTMVAQPPAAAGETTAAPAEGSLIGPEGLPAGASDGVRIPAAERAVPPTSHPPALPASGAVAPANP